MDTLTLKKLGQELNLYGLLETLEERLKQAREDVLSFPECMGLLLQDEKQYREAKKLLRRLLSAKFEEEKTFEKLELTRYCAEAQRLIRELITGNYLLHQQHVLMMGPTGTGKTHIAQALGHQACRQGKSVRFIRASIFYREMHRSRADDTYEKQMKKFCSYTLLILDDFGLKNMTMQEAEDFYELVAQRHHKGSLIMTSNRSVEGWLSLFPDPVKANAVLDRIVNKSYPLVLEGIESYRKNLRPNLGERGNQ